MARTYLSFIILGLLNKHTKIIVSRINKISTPDTTAATVVIVLKEYSNLLPTESHDTSIGKNIFNQAGTSPITMEPD
jgi:hypothetical protein